MKNKRKPRPFMFTPFVIGDRVRHENGKLGTVKRVFTGHTANGTEYYSYNILFDSDKVKGWGQVPHVDSTGVRVLRLVKSRRQILDDILGVRNEHRDEDKTRKPVRKDERIKSVLDSLFK